MTGDMSGNQKTGEGLCLYDSHPALRRRAGALSFKVGKGIGFWLSNTFYFTHFSNELTSHFSFLLIENWAIAIILCRITCSASILKSKPEITFSTL